MQIVERNEQRLVVRHEPWDVWLSTGFTVLVGILIVAYALMHERVLLLLAGATFVVAVPLFTAHVARLVTATFDRASGRIEVVRRGLFGTRVRTAPLGDVTGVECSPFLERQPRSIRDRRLRWRSGGGFVVRLRLTSGKTLSLASMRSCELGHHRQLASAIRSFLGLEAEERVA
jgi:hypothetical protein